MCAEVDLASSVRRFVGHMGMWSENHLAVHLSGNRLRQRAGLALERCIVSERANLRSLEREYGDLFDVVPHAQVQALLETRDERYRAVLSFQKGTINPVLLCEQTLIALGERYGKRLRVFEDARVDRIELDAKQALLAVAGVRVRAERVVLCTNGYRNAEIENRAGDEIDLAFQQALHGTMGFMAAYFDPQGMPSAAISYLASARIGEGQAYYYVTRRPFVWGDREGTLVAIGGPDRELADWADYDPAHGVDPSVVEQIDAFVRRIVVPGRLEPLSYPWAWHGLMGYTRDGVRVIGVEPRNPVLLYNLGCNGVGLLPSVSGGARIGRILAGEQLPASAFDPR
jgi:glycine/D-amino acid oxidase-like deaminating enzyme